MRKTVGTWVPAGRANLYGGRENEDRKDWREVVRHYTFSVMCSFRLQETFTEEEVEPDPDGDESDREPTEEALDTLRRELHEYLSEHYSISKLEVYADSENLLGITEDPDA